MSKASPTLADAMIREWSRPDYRVIDPNNWIATHIAKARKFVLDNSMSAFMADLGYQSFNGCRTTKKKIELIEGMRRMSRLPHALTWIEFNKLEHRRRVKEVYHSDIDAGPDDVPDLCGWLLMQHPTVETAFMALHTTSHAWTNEGRVAVPNCGQFAYSWTCDDSTPPWPRDPFYHHTQIAYQKPDKTAFAQYTNQYAGSPKGLVTPAAVLVGLPEYITETVSINACPGFSGEAHEAFKRSDRWQFNPLGEMAHDMRYLWSLLSTINELPISRKEIRPDKGYVSRGRYRRFSEHTVISLTVPVKRYQVVAKRAIAIARRRGHQVRGHFRKDRWHPGEHIWIREHVRGDTSLGFVLHDYEISKGQTND